MRFDAELKINELFFRGLLEFNQMKRNAASFV